MVLGIILIVIGIISLGFGIAGAIKQMFATIKKDLDEGRSAGIEDVLTPKMVEALTKFLKALSAAPIYLILILLGLGLVIWGSTMLGLA